MMVNSYSIIIDNGNLANGLFEVLDSQYVQNMEDVIRRIQAKEFYNTHLLKKQNSILDSTINVKRTSNDGMERRVRHMETHEGSRTTY